MCVVLLSLFGVGCFWAMKNSRCVVKVATIIVVDEEKECFLLLTRKKKRVK